MTNSHLHEYIVKEDDTKSSTMTSRQLVFFLEDENPQTVIIEDDINVSSVFKNEGSEVVFNYDLGDDWKVSIRRVTQSIDYSDDIEEFGLISLQGEGIIEDCGGVEELNLNNQS